MRLSGAIDGFCTFIGKAVTWLILAAVLVSAGNATIRKAFDMSSNAWLELQWYMFGAVVLLGASHTLRRNEHVRVDILYSSVSERSRIWIDIVGFVLFFLPVGFALLTIQGVSELIKRIAALQGRIRLETRYDKPLQ